MAPEQAAADPQRRSSRRHLRVRRAWRTRCCAGRPPFTRDVAAAGARGARHARRRRRSSRSARRAARAQRARDALPREEAGGSLPERGRDLQRSSKRWRRRAAAWRRRPRPRRRDSAPARRRRSGARNRRAWRCCSPPPRSRCSRWCSCCARRLGLPDWVLGGRRGAAAIGLPIMLVTGRKERERVHRRRDGNVSRARCGCREASHVAEGDSGRRTRVRHARRDRDRLHGHARARHWIDRNAAGEGADQGSAADPPRGVRESRAGLDARADAH